MFPVIKLDIIFQIDFFVLKQQKHDERKTKTRKEKKRLSKL